MYNKIQPKKNAVDNSVDTADFAKKVNFGSLKSDIDKLAIDKLEKVANNLGSIWRKLDKL